MSDDNTKSKSKQTQSIQTIDASITIQHLLKVMVDKLGSDLHIVVGAPPSIRINGEVVRMNIASLRKEDSKRLVYGVLSESQKRNFEKNLELDFSFGITKLARFRANVFYSKGGVSAVFRFIPSAIPDFQQLNLPNTIIKMTSVSNGIILVTGPTGSGKSTTIASILDYLNKNTTGHIITLEDPIEFVHQHKGCIINQREIGTDTANFQDAIKRILRQDPDIVLIGELRDAETIEAALTIAETGHLVFGTLHTNSAVQTLNRIINAFPADRHDAIRTLLSFVLQGVISQQLLPKTFEPGRVCALEIMSINPAIKNLIREKKIHQIYSQMQVGQDKTGMVTMNQNLMKFVSNGVIDNDTALSYSNEPEELAKNLAVKKS